MTFAEMKAQIADELSRSDLTSQIGTAINQAIVHYQRQRFYFNETIFTFSTVASQEFYDDSDDSDIPNLVAIDSMKILVNGSTYALTPQSYAYIDFVQTNAGYTGDPVWYAYYAQQIRLYPIPQAVRTMTVSGVIKYAALSADADENQFTIEAEELIRARATAMLYGNTIKTEPAEEARWRGVEMAALAALQEEYANRGPSKLLPTDF